MASTYVNDLRLNEMATGDASGTWGNITNTNLELIGEALGYATQDCFTSDADATTTVADGATDPARAMYFKVTSSATLSATRTLTIAPNTVSRLQFIENATTGSQSINISQGSGANVTIPTGDTKAVYLDGAGSGAAVTDAFASLSVVDLKVQDDLTVTDDMTVGGTLGVTGVLTGTSLDISGDIDVDGTTNLDVVDIDGAVDMASTLQVDGAITSSAGATITTADNTDQLTLVSTDADANVGPSLNLYRNSSSPADSDLAGIVNFTSRNDNSQDFTVASLDASVIDVSDGTEDGRFRIKTMTGGALKTVSFVGGNMTVSDSQEVRFGDAADLKIYHDGTDSHIDNDTGDLTLDVAGDIILDADGGDIKLSDGGTVFGELTNVAGYLRIKSPVSNADIEFVGNDGGSTITALTLDMSDAGRAFFNSGVELKSDIRIKNDDGQAIIRSDDTSGSSATDYGDIIFKGFRATSDETTPLFLDGATGKVGMGTTAPLTLSGNADPGLTIKSNGPYILLQDANNVNSIRYLANNGGTFNMGIVNDDGSGNKTEQFTLNSSGKCVMTGLAGSDYVLRVFSDRNNNDGYGIRTQVGTDAGTGTHYHIDFADGDDTLQGSITSDNGTVTYGAFTAHHPCIIPDADNDADSSDRAYPYGTLLEITSLSYTQKNGVDTERGILYNVQKSSSAKSKAVIGAYGSSMNSAGRGDTNLHQALILGDGHILCNNENGNIEIGDYICTSSTSGEGMKATSICTTIGIAREAVTFTDSTAVLVAVEYGYRQFVPEDLEARIAALEG